MKKSIAKKGFLTVDLVLAIAVFSMLSLAAISLTVSYEKNIIAARKKQEMNFYIESIAKEIKYSMQDSELDNIKNRYINKAAIESNKIEKEKLINIVEDKVEDSDFYIEVNLDVDKTLSIKYINNKIGVKYSDEEKIKLA